jgi:hypothetical protein
MAQLSRDIPEVDRAVRDYVFLRLLEGARAQGFINIYRNDPIVTAEKVSTSSLRNGQPCVAETESFQKSA